MLKDIQFRSVYKSDLHNILEDFYMPALSEATHYDRCVGFFSASTISCAAQGLSIFAKKKGKIRLILGAFSDRRDIDAVLAGYDQRALADKIGEEFLKNVSAVDDDLFRNRFETLSWLVAYQRLDIKIALRAKGMYHDKVGVISDGKNSFVFSGSANESASALLPTFNYESISVFPSWKPELEDYYRPHLDSFERLWSNKSSGTLVIDIPDAVRDKMIKIGRQMDYQPSPEIEAAVAERLRLQTDNRGSDISLSPRLPPAIGGRPFVIQEHQRNALMAWKSKGDFQGVFDLATGAGKTITSMVGIVRLSESVPGLACVIAVPYQDLADQWVDVLSLFNIYPIRCYVSKANWYDSLNEMVHDITAGGRKFGAVVVVNRTLKSPEFQNCIAKLNSDRFLFIGDECHHHSSASFAGKLPLNARFRIGLSATPEHYMDEERNERLNDYYGDVVYRYTLRQAIEDKVLTPYKYYPNPVELTTFEAEEFVRLSDEIGRLMARSKGGLNESSTTQLNMLAMKRARIVGAAANKLTALEQTLAAMKPESHALFYCGDGKVSNEDSDDDQSVDESETRQIEAVSKLLARNGWDTSRFTSREGRKDREAILNHFRIGNIDALVAIRCLDEGIDVPACRTAFILASSRDPRQFVQRRGRILRRSDNKEFAVIHDYVVVLPAGMEDESEHAKRLVKAELMRVAEFSSMSMNRPEAYHILSDVLRRYDLEHLI